MRTTDSTRSTCWPISGLTTIQLIVALAQLVVALLLLWRHP